MDPITRPVEEVKAEIGTVLRWAFPLVPNDAPPPAADEDPKEDA